MRSTFSQGARIPLTTRKLLAAKGVNIAVEGEELVIDDHRVRIADTAAVKELVETVHEVLRERDERDEKKDKKIEKQAAVIEQGREEIEELQRNYDALTEDSTFEKAVMQGVKAMITLVSEVKLLSDEEKADRSEQDLKTFAEQWFQLRDAYGARQSLSARGDGELTMENIMDRAIAETSGADEEEPI
jgi:response regulator RpfG family c-di-GMP phosphodiesterase